MNKLESHVEQLFAKHKKNKDNIELKAEILSNLEAKVADLRENGMEESLAIDTAINDMDNLDFLTAAEKDINRKKCYAVFKYGILLILFIYCSNIACHYIRYNNALKLSTQIEADFRADIKEFKENTRRIINFNTTEMKSIRNMDLNALDLKSILTVFYNTLNIPAANVVFEEYSLLKNNEDSREEDGSVSTRITPKAVVYAPHENKTYYKIAYAIKINKPFLWQGQDSFIFKINEFNYFFGYSKYHYLSEHGERIYDYSSKDFMPAKRFPNSDLQLAFAVRRKINGINYYLEGISGVIIIEETHLKDLFTYSQYTHKGILRSKAASKLCSGWSLQIDNQ